MLRGHVLAAHGELYEEVVNMYQSVVHLEFAKQVIDLATKDGESG